MSQYRALIPFLIFFCLLLLAGCTPSIESNINGVHVTRTTPDYPHIFTKKDIEMDVKYENYTTRLVNPETEEHFLYLLDEEYMYFLIGNRENLNKILAAEGKVQFGFLLEEPRQAENPSVDLIKIPLDDLVEETKTTDITFEFIDMSQSKYIKKFNIDVTKGGFKE